VGKCTKCAPGGKLDVSASVYVAHRAQPVHSAAMRGAISVPTIFEPVALSPDKEAAEAKSRLVHLALLGLNLRFMENWRSAQIDSGRQVLDYESLMILMAIIVISAERVFRTELESDLQTLANQLPASNFARVNLSSIAAATAINRETVRRKVNNLQKAGWVSRDQDGIRTVPGVIPYEVLRNSISAQVDALTRTANQLARLGVLSPKLIAG
jgi:hypothetical protein